MQFTKMDLGPLENIRAGIRKRITVAQLGSAMRIRAEAQNVVPKDTTALSLSLYISTKTGSDYTERMTMAHAVWEEAMSIGHTPKGYKLTANTEFERMEEERPIYDSGDVYIVAGMKYAEEYDVGEIIAESTMNLSGYYKNRVQQELEKLVGESEKARIWSVRNSGPFA